MTSVGGIAVRNSPRATLGALLTKACVGLKCCLGNGIKFQIAFESTQSFTQNDSYYYIFCFPM